MKTNRIEFGEIAKAIFAGVIVLTIAVALSDTLSEPGVSIALFGFIGKAIKSAAGIAGKIVGVGGGGGKPIQITTGTDPALKTLLSTIAAQNARAMSIRDTPNTRQQQSGGFFTTKVAGIPLGGIIIFGVLGLGAVFLAKK